MPSGRPKLPPPPPQAKKKKNVPKATTPGQGFGGGPGEPRRGGKNRNSMMILKAPNIEPYYRSLIPI